MLQVVLKFSIFSVIPTDKGLTCHFILSVHRSVTITEHNVYYSTSLDASVSSVVGLLIWCCLPFPFCPLW